MDAISICPTNFRRISKNEFANSFWRMWNGLGHSKRLTTAINSNAPCLQAFRDHDLIWGATNFKACSAELESAALDCKPRT